MSNGTTVEKLAPVQQDSRPSLQQLAADTLQRDGTVPALEYGDRWYHWAELSRLAHNVQAMLDEAGVAPGTPVALLSRNRPEMVAALFGLLARGHTVRMIYAFQSATGIARDVERLTPAALIGGLEDFPGETIDALVRAGLVGIALNEMEAEFAPGCVRLRPGVETNPPVEPQIEILTSGTTGPPKQFAIPHRMIANHMVGSAMMHQGSVDFQSQPPFLLFFPLGNISGIYSTIPSMIRGNRVTLIDRFTLAAWHAHVLKYRPVHTGLPPAGVQMLLDSDIPADDLSSIRMLGVGAAPLDPMVQKAFEDRYGIPILLSYGATEFGGPVASMTPDLVAKWGRAKLGSVGRAMAGCELRIIDADHFVPLPAGREGLLEVKVDRIGPDWIRTSDIGLIDEDGFFFHRGRADGAIIRGGFKLLPETIERALLTHPDIAAVSVVGVVDRRLGHVPGAAIELRPNRAEPSHAELEAFARTHLLSTHIPAHWRIVPALPRNNSMKIDRRAVIALFDEPKGPAS